MQSTQLPLCTLCNKFYANPATQNMCSGCYKIFLQNKLEATATEIKPAPVKAAEKEEEKKAPVVQKPVQVAILIICRRTQPNAIYAIQELAI